jgi:hypothetical protein
MPASAHDAEQTALGDRTTELRVVEAITADRVKNAHFLNLDSLALVRW